MVEDHNENSVTRREFLRRAAAGAALTAGAGLGLGLPAALAGDARPSAGMKYRVLGRTKLKVSELGLGTIKTNNPAVVRRALDLGVNYFDTAECYQGSKSEIKLGEGLKGRREEAVVATKWHTNGRTPAARLLKSLDKSLERLGMDHVDLIQIHGAGNVAQVNSDELWEAFTRAREAGKVRFNGVTTHGNQVEVIRAAIECGRYDAVLPSYNAMIGERVGRAVREAHEAGLGTIIMKALQPAHEGKAKRALAKFKGNAHQQAIRWVLDDPNVSTVIVDMPTFDELEEDVAAVTGAASRAEMEEFERGVAQIAGGACHLCGSCTGQCPRNVRVADIMRYSLYHDGYGDRARAVELYRALPAHGSAAPCRDCSECQVVCPWGVPIRSRLERAHVRLA
ncbi:MAG: aldo/keto reductase [Armatimonadota bacterium]|nr:MAG: aldo/keto reductase [Armatimonadota bacterium]